METIRSWFTYRKQTNLDEAFHAVYNNLQLSELKKVAKKGIRNSNGLTLLHQAVVDQDVEKVRQLLGAGFDIYAVCQKKTALHMALLLQYTDIAHALLEHGCDPEHRAISSQFYHPWHIVMSIIDVGMCQALTEMLITHGADVNREIRLSQQLIAHLPFTELRGMRVCRDFAPVIQLAIGRNDLAMVERFVDSAAEPWRTCNSCSALTRCLTLDISNRLEITRLLLSNESEANDAEELIHAASDCSWDFTPLQICILCSGVHVDDSPGGSGGSSSSDGSSTDKEAVLEVLLAEGANPAFSAAECKFQFIAGRVQPSLPVPIHEENPCLYPLCLCVQQLWYAGVLQLVQANCPVTWAPLEHMPASRTEHATPIQFALSRDLTHAHIAEHGDAILQILHLLYQAGADFFSMADDCVDGLHAFISSHRAHALSQWFTAILTRPPSLKICTRAFIRRALGLNPLLKRDQLERYIPREIVNYVMFTEHTSI